MDNIDGRKIPVPVREQIRFETIENWLAGKSGSSSLRASPLRPIRLRRRPLEPFVRLRVSYAVPLSCSKFSRNSEIRS